MVPKPSVMVPTSIWQHILGNPDGLSHRDTPTDAVAPSDGDRSWCRCGSVCTGILQEDAEEITDVLPPVTNRTLGVSGVRYGAVSADTITSLVTEHRDRSQYVPTG